MAINSSVGGLKLTRELLKWLKPLTGCTMPLDEITSLNVSLRITRGENIGWADINGERYGNYSVPFSRTGAFAAIVKRWGHFSEDAEIRSAEICIEPDSIITIQSTCLAQTPDK